VSDCVAEARGDGEWRHAASQYVFIGTIRSLFDHYCIDMHARARVHTQIHTDIFPIRKSRLYSVFLM
jgi:hypothetical protein